MKIKMFLIELLRKLTRTVRGEISTQKLIKNGLKVGKNYSRQAGVRIDPSYPYLITIGDNVIMAPNVTILAHDASLKNHLGITKTAPVIIEDDVFIGANSTVLCGVRIGKNAIVAAGAVVTKNIPQDEIWGGNPAKFIMTIEEYMKNTMSKCNQNNTVETFELKSYWIKNGIEEGNIVYQKCNNYKEKENIRNKIAESRKK